MAEFVITVLEERPDIVNRRVVTPNAACCEKFNDEYGSQWTIAADGVPVPASLRIDRGAKGICAPKYGMIACPFCLANFAVEIQAVGRVTNPPIIIKG